MAATPNQGGQSGYINMPSAVVETDGTFSVGYSYNSPYGQTWVTSSILPFLQVTGRYVSITGIPAFGINDTGYGKGYGRYKDKVLDVKLRLWTEGDWMPSVAIGETDVFGTELFNGQYIVATKTFGASKNVEASLGYARKRPDGLFAGARWTPASLPRWSMVAEYDTTNYSRDYLASGSGAALRHKGPSLGLEYRWGWLALQAARSRDQFSINASVSIPFGEREFIPKLFEPAYFVDDKNPPPLPSKEEWHRDPGYGADLVNALVKQDYKNIRVEQEGNVLSLSLTNSRISNLGRAVGRAARTAVAFTPQGVTTLRITYTKLDQPIATYEFFDLPKLNDYLAGKIDRQAFLDVVLLRYPEKSDVIRDEQQTWLQEFLDKPAVSKPVVATAPAAAPVVTAAVHVSPVLAAAPASQVLEIPVPAVVKAGDAVNTANNDGKLAVGLGVDGDVVQVKSLDREANRFKIAPKVGFFFNDPSGAFRYSISAVANYDRRLGDGWYFNSAASLQLMETVSGVKQPSNSELPHVRSDVADYLRGSRFSLSRILLNKYDNPAERVYTRLSAGLYEEMFRGAGGQVLYLPKDSRWAADLAVDALQQRGFKGLLDSRDYKTVTAIGSLHYRLPHDITVTARAGRFLAKDTGVRMEFKRRFQSGIEVGAWYSHTNGNDITSPGTPAQPYQDRGVFLSIPLNSMLPMDTQSTAGFALSPWTRDVGQMVASPGDLYDMVERPRADMHSYDGLGNFAERPDEQNLPAVNPPDRPFVSPWPAMRARLEQSSSAMPTPPEWLKATALIGGVAVSSALLDKPVDRFVKKHENSTAFRNWDKLGKAMPYALVGAAGAALAFGDDRMQNTGLISMQSVAAATGLALAGKYAIGRARPDEERGPWSSVGSGTSRSDASFPSTHSAVAFAAVTPFAKEYDAPWLYGVAAVGSAGRIAGRKHWVSDTVAGGLVGYAMGSWLWNAQRDQSKSGLSINPGPKEVSVTWQSKY
ncbi:MULTISPECIES: YjbH domain-containing protein [unclassified Janthinobacterium]|uniref:YjbH domain-containing protein n=1 Tax=unclassified Janthinobacterium TaxID=2610881 RepID=UPI00160A6538|nr:MULTISPECIES: YjbH domain-containing protein [unclassified Janthinobacterium]MBB5608591.1 membrane-associated phospholipid phosphatase [Janthinobacterium sp. S3T4]MBB5614112.1 membrane-associated phospholipid phosphatase [Janthinobacterium sp. S3M3]